MMTEAEEKLNEVAQREGEEHKTSVEIVPYSEYVDFIGNQKVRIFKHVVLHAIRYSVEHVRKLSIEPTLSIQIYNKQYGWWRLVTLEGLIIVKPQLYIPAAQEFTIVASCHGELVLDCMTFQELQ